MGDSWAIETLEIERYRLVEKRRRAMDVPVDGRASTCSDQADRRRLAGVVNALKVLRGGKGRSE